MSDDLVRSILKAKMYKFKAITKKNKMIFFNLPSSLLIILYKLTKFEAPSCNGFWDIKFSNLQRAITQKKLEWFFLIFTR